MTFKYVSDRSPRYIDLIMLRKVAIIYIIIAIITSVLSGNAMASFSISAFIVLISFYRYLRLTKFFYQEFELNEEGFLKILILKRDNAIIDTSLEKSQYQIKLERKADGIWAKKYRLTVLINDIEYIQGLNSSWTEERFEELRNFLKQNGIGTIDWKK